MEDYLVLFCIPNVPSIEDDTLFVCFFFLSPWITVEHSFEVHFSLIII